MLRQVDSPDDPDVVCDCGGLFILPCQHGCECRKFDAVRGERFESLEGGQGDVLVLDEVLFGPVALLVCFSQEVFDVFGGDKLCGSRFCRAAGGWFGRSDVTTAGRCPRYLSSPRLCQAGGWAEERLAPRRADGGCRATRADMTSLFCDESECAALKTEEVCCAERDT